MSEPLAVYIHDHLAGAQVALETLRRMRDHASPRYRQFAEGLLREIEEDEATLLAIGDSVAAGASVVKRVSGWLMEKAARVKIGHSKSEELEVFESIELLAAGVFAKLLLWKALQAAAAQDERLRMYDFDRLIGRAQRQHDVLEEERLTLARYVFAPQP